MKKLTSILIGMTIAFYLVPSSHASDCEMVVGKWYDNLQSPKFLDSTLTIKRDASCKMIYIRLNGDGSGSTVQAIQTAENRYSLMNEWGSYYVIDEDGDLGMFDKNGYIRTALKFVK